jgi:glutathione S-transferase
VAVALRLYGFAYEHRPWSVFADAEQIAGFNPLRRVPVLVLDDGVSLVESAAILDWLDELAGPERALIARAGPARRDALRFCALATGLADKAVSLVYERVIHERSTSLWLDRCRDQITGVLDNLEGDREARESVWWFGDRIGHADIAVACVLRFLSEAHSQVFAPGCWPALARHAAHCEALEAFQSVVQPFVVTLPEGASPGGSP